MICHLSYSNTTSRTKMAESKSWGRIETVSPGAVILANSIAIVLADSTEVPGLVKKSASEFAYKIIQILT